MKIIYNGKPLEVTESISIHELLTQTGSAEGVLVELNGDILTMAADYKTVLLAENDNINAFRIVAGG